MIFQRLLTDFSGQQVYFLTTTGLFIKDSSEPKFTSVWTLGKDSKTTLLPVGSVNEKFAILCDSLKQVYLVRLADGQIQGQYRAEKCPTCILFESCNEEKVEMLVADRFGDISRVIFSLGKEMPVEVKVIVGHVSIITDLAISGDALISADRDEKLRVTCRTSPHIIKSFLLGHTDYVVAAKAIDGQIISVAGDGTIRLWRLEADNSDSKATQLSSFVIDAEKYGRKVKTERVISKTETEAQVEEEVEEIEKLLVEPHSLILCKTDGKIAVTFDRSNRILVVRIVNGRIEFVKDLQLPEDQQILSAVYINSDDLQILSYNNGQFSLHTSSNLIMPIELGTSEGSSAAVDSLWMGVMRKDCHGLFAKRVKSKRSKADQDLSDIDDE